MCLNGVGELQNGFPKLPHSPKFCCCAHFFFALAERSPLHGNRIWGTFNQVHLPGTLTMLMKLSLKLHVRSPVSDPPFRGGRRIFFEESFRRVAVFYYYFGQRRRDSAMRQRWFQPMLEIRCQLDAFLCWSPGWRAYAISFCAYAITFPVGSVFSVC